MRRGRHHEGAQVAGARHARAPPALLVPMDEWQNAPRPAARLALPLPSPIVMYLSLLLFKCYEYMISLYAVRLVTE